jgi:hypothetical protein
LLTNGHTIDYENQVQKLSNIYFGPTLMYVNTIVYSIYDYFHLNQNYMIDTGAGGRRDFKQFMVPVLYKIP